MQLESRSTKIKGDDYGFPWNPRKCERLLSIKELSMPVKSFESFLRVATSGRGKPNTIFSTISALQLRIKWWLYVNGKIQLTKKRAQRVAAPSFLQAKMIVFSINNAERRSKTYS